MLWNKVQKQNDVCFCRMSPLQKGMVAEWIKQNQKIVCAVGDGTNDQSMIINANVGICVESQNQSETSEISDFKINEFQDLKSLISFHGRKTNKGFCFFLVFILWQVLYQSSNMFYFNFYSRMGYQELYTNFFLLFSSLVYYFSMKDMCLTYDDIQESEIYDYSQIYIFNQKRYFLSAKNILVLIFNSCFQSYAL